MRILDLRVENIGKIKLFEFRSDGKSVVIGGKNGQGKSSVLNAIEMLLAGKRSFTKKPVREGLEEGLITAELEGGFFVERTISSEGSSSLTIKNKDSAKYSSPQTLLDGFRGSNTLDPVKFLNMDDKNQLALLRELVGLDFSKLDAEFAEVYAERTQVNKKGVELKTLIESIQVDEDTPSEELNSAKLSVELEEAQKLVSSKKARQEVLNLIAKLKQEIKTAEETLANLDESIWSLNKKKIREIEYIKADLSSITETNYKVSQKKRKEELQLQIEPVRKQSEALTIRPKEIEAEKQSLLEKAKFPLAGLTFAEDGILYNGIPFSQASSAERLRVSTAIAFALQPTLEVVLVRDGSLLDDENLKAIQEVAEQYSGHLWIERVGEGEECSIVLEDGEAKHVK